MEEDEKEFPTERGTVKAEPAKPWEEWFDIIDGAGGDGEANKEIESHLNDQYEGPIARQKQPETYQQARSPKDKLGKKNGFEINASKTLPLPVDKCFKSWADETYRAKWLPEQLTIRKSVNKKSMRITWDGDQSHLNVYFYNKGTNKSLVSIQHTKLKSEQDAQTMKAFWKERLESLKNLG